MAQVDKLVARVKTVPPDLKWSEFLKFMRHMGYKEVDNKGKTSGSRVRFIHEQTGRRILLHKPHNPPVVAREDIRDVLEQLQDIGYL